MLRLRYFVPLVSPNARCSLQSILDLPPELRQISVRSFSTTTLIAASSSAPQSQPVDETPSPIESNETSLTPTTDEDGSHAQPEAESRARRRQQHAGLQQQSSDNMIPGSRSVARVKKEEKFWFKPVQIKHKLKGISAVVAARNELDATARSTRYFVRKDGGITTQEEADMIEVLSSRPQELQSQNAPSVHDEKMSIIEQIGDTEKTTWARKVAREERRVQRRAPISSDSRRLEFLKKILTESADVGATAPVIERQLAELEEKLRDSMKKTLSRRTSNPGRKTPNTDFTQSTHGGTPDTVSATELSPLVFPRESSLLGVQEDRTSSKYGISEIANGQLHSQNLASEGSQPFTQDLIARPEAISVFTDLKAQIQELSALLKELVPHQASLQDSELATALLPPVLERTYDLIGSSSAILSRNLTGTPLQEMRRADADTRTLNTDLRDVTTEDGTSTFATLPHEIDIEGEPALPSKSARHMAATSTSTLIAGTSASIDSRRRVREASKAPTSPTKTRTILDPSRSLYEQLFPEEVQRPFSTPEDRKPIPRLSLPLDEDTSASQEYLAKPVFKSEQLAQVYDARLKHKKTVLRLKYASKVLTEDDFRRAMPRGQHLQEWTTKGEFEKVIPMRDFWTLERTGDYYIVFNNGKAADAFMQHVKRVFEMTKQYTPTSLLNPLPSAPTTLLPNGLEDGAELVKNFSLLSPTMSLSLTRETLGIRGDVLENGGYQQALSGGLTAETPQVILGMNGGVMPNWFQIRDAIARHGARCSLPWDIIPGDLGIRKLAMRRPTRASLEAAWEPGSVNAENWDVDGNMDELADGAMRDVQDRLSPGPNGQRWLVAFKKREDAQRFARTWHMRSFPWATADNSKDRIYRGRTMVKAEMLW